MQNFGSFYIWFLSAINKKELIVLVICLSSVRSIITEKVLLFYGFNVLYRRDRRQISLLIPKDKEVNQFTQILESKFTDDL